MAEHAFSLILTGEPDAYRDGLLEAAGDDATFFSGADRRAWAAFVREAADDRTAIRSAIEAVESVEGVTVRRVESHGCATTVFNAALDLRDIGAQDRSPGFASLAGNLGIRCDSPAAGSPAPDVTPFFADQDDAPAAPSEPAFVATVADAQPGKRRRNWFRTPTPPARPIVGLPRSLG